MAKKRKSKAPKKTRKVGGRIYRLKHRTKTKSAGKKYCSTQKQKGMNCSNVKVNTGYAQYTARSKSRKK